jgi:hypothetical protein
LPEVVCRDNEKGLGCRTGTGCTWRVELPWFWNLRSALFQLMLARLVTHSLFLFFIRCFKRPTMDEILDMLNELPAGTKT